MTQPGQIVYPLASFRFSVEIAGISQAVFQECTGFAATTNAKEVEEGGLNGYVHKLPGRTTFTNITLKRGVTNSQDLWNWYMDVVSKNDKSSVFKDVSVVQFDHDFAEVYRFNLTRAWPTKWTGPSFSATSSGDSVESFELAFEDLKRVFR